MIDTRYVWENALKEIQTIVSPANFSTWFKGTHIVKVEEGTVFLGVPSQFYKDWLADKHHKTILRALRNTLEDVRAIEYVISREENKHPRIIKYEPPVSQELPLHEHYINRADNLNPRYTFDNFIVGSFNDLAHAAGQAVIKGPGITYNPLFIYGNTGYGKTHLIQAIGNQLKHNNSQRKIFYTTSERYGNDIISAIQQNTIQSVKERYRSYDVLILDDIQFISGKEKLQEELFHIFNSLYEDNKQVIFSSDRHPSRITDIADRLRSRFGQGMIVDVSAPDHESRVAILKAKAAQNNFVLSDTLAQSIADEVAGNIRDLEGVLNRVMCETSLNNRSLDATDIRAIMRENLKPKKTMSVEDIVSHVARYYNIPETSIYEKTRKKEVVKPRQVVMFIMREDFGISYPTIGQHLGGRDHTTVIHSCEKMRADIQESPALQHELDEIRGLFG
jgi:chromosomal replication initiator protein